MTKQATEHERMGKRWMARIAASLALLLATAMGAGVALSGCGDDTLGGPRVLRLGHALDTSHPVHKAMEQMARSVEEKSDGTLTIEIFPNAQLGDERESVEQVQFGGMDMTKCSAGVLESFVGEMAVFGLPYLFRDEAHYWAALEGEVGRDLLAAGEESGLKGLCYYDAGARSFYTVNRPIRTPEDLRGLKIRVMQTNMAIEMVKLLGGSPTPMAWGELYTSLQQGVVDGAENNPPTLVSSGHYEVSKYFTLDEHTRLPDVLLIRKQTWERLSPEQQQILEEAARESSQYMRTLWGEAEVEALETAREAGVEIIEPDKTSFREAVQPLWEKQQGTRIGELAEQIQRIEETTTATEEAPATRPAG